MSAEAGASMIAPVAGSPSSLEQAVSPPPGGEAGAAFLRRAQLAEDRLAEVLAAYRTLKSENDGHRERVTRNVERRFEGRRERLLLRFIEILDNLDRALEAAETSFASPALVEGLILVRTQLLNTLQDEGLERVPALGRPYDPHVSEAVETCVVTEAEHHHLVVKELLRGYKLNGRVARASRVVVGEYVEGGEEGATLAQAPAPGRPQRQAPSTPQPFAPPATPPGFAPPAAGRSEAELTLDEIIAHAEALERPRPRPKAAPPAPAPAAAKAPAPPPADEADAEADEIGDDLLGYLGDDTRPK